MGNRDILMTVVDNVAELRLSRPQALNAFTPAMLEEMLDALAEVDSNPQIRALLITGSGRAFSSGADLADEPLAADIDAGLLLETHYNPLIARMFDLQVPIVTAVNGPAAGGGCSIALAGDIVIAARSAYFVQAFARIGLVPDVGATWLLPRIVGRNRASAMMMLGDRIDAERAERWGLVHEVTEDDALLPAARAVAQRLSRGPTTAYRLIRHGIRRALEMPLTDTLTMERNHQREAGRTADFTEGVAAFLEQRQPLFAGQ